LEHFQIPKKYARGANCYVATIPSNPAAITAMILTNMYNFFYEKDMYIKYIK